MIVVQACETTLAVRGYSDSQELLGGQSRKTIWQKEGEGSLYPRARRAVLDMLVVAVEQLRAG